VHKKQAATNQAVKRPLDRKADRETGYFMVVVCLGKCSGKVGTNVGKKKETDRGKLYKRREEDTGSIRDGKPV
jgi:hypothetical protein